MILHMSITVAHAAGTFEIETFWPCSIEPYSTSAKIFQFQMASLTCLSLSGEETLSMGNNTVATTTINNIFFKLGKQPLQHNKTIA